MLSGSSTASLLVADSIGLNSEPNVKGRKRARCGKAIQALSMQPRQSGDYLHFPGSGNSVLEKFATNSRTTAKEQNGATSECAMQV